MTFSAGGGPSSQMATRRHTIACDVRALASPDAGMIDALARLGLMVRRLGFELRLCRVPDELAELIAFAGLCEVLGVQPGGQAEQREEGLSVEKEGELGDPLR